MFFSLCCFLVGCKFNINSNNHTVTIKDIEGSLFDDIDRVVIIRDEGKYTRELSVSEIKILRIAIKNATNLVELSDDITYQLSHRAGNLKFVLVTYKKNYLQFIYDTQTRYIYIYSKELCESRRNEKISGSQTWKFVGG